MDFIYTSHQVPRGSKPDADIGDKLYLIKNVSQLRLTYQVKMLAYMAKTRGKKLFIQLPKGAKVHASLKNFVNEMSGLVKIERV